MRRGDETLRLRLRASKVLPLEADPAAMLRLAQQEVARNERWPEPVRFQDPHFFEGNWLVSRTTRATA